MDSPALMRKLIEIERALGQLDNCAIRNLILEAQQGVQRIESENDHLVHENSRLHRQVENARQSPQKRFAAQGCACGSSLSREAPAPLRSAEDSPCRLLAWRTTHFFFS